MNIENLRKLRTRLRSRKNPVGFNMGKWFAHNELKEEELSRILTIVDEHPCGTVACLAGHAAIIAAQEGLSPLDCSFFGHGEIFSTAAEFLDLTEEEAERLFYGRWYSGYYGNLSKIPKHAAIRELTRVIRIEEGEKP